MTKGGFDDGTTYLKHVFFTSSFNRSKYEPGVAPLPLKGGDLHTVFGCFLSKSTLYLMFVQIFHVVLLC